MSLANSLPGGRRITWLLVAFAGTTLFLGMIASMVIYADAHSAVASEDLVSHTQDVLLNLASASEQLDRVELNAQLYRVTGSENYVESAQAGTVQLNTLAQRLNNVVQSSDAQRRHAEDLVAATSTLSGDVDRMTPTSGPVQNAVVNCRRILNLMEDQEQMLLAARGAEQQRENLYSVVRRAAVIVVGTLLILTLFGFLIRDAVRSGQFEERLSEANTRLRTTVQRLEEQAFEARLLIDARDEVALCQDVKQAEECTLRYFAQLIPGTAGSLCLIHPSRQMMENAGSWGVVQGTALFEGFAPESCCALRSGRPRWRRPEQSEVHCTHFAGQPPERYLCLPVVAHGETLGVVTIEALSSEAASLVEAREDAVVSLAEMAAMTIAGLNLRERLERQSIRDGMTGLFNRSFMEVALERELHRAARQQKDLAVLMVDIDHFKQFNDTFGHEAGDVVLREVAECLRLGVRSEDIACRYGGEEFVIILPEVSLAAATERAELLRARVEDLAPRYHGQGLRKVTVSIGLASARQNSAVPEELLRFADRAMYAAKHRGRNRVVQADNSTFS